jgi:lipopolysaccharide transport system permease protein
MADSRRLPFGTLVTLITDVKQLTRYQELLYTLTLRDIKVRYKQSVMGLLWAVLMPALIVGAGVLVRIVMGKVSGSGVTSADIGSVTVRALLWSFTVGALRFGTASLVTNANLVTKIAFPREVFPLASVLSSLADFGVAAAFGLVVLFPLGWVPSVHALWSIPIIALTAIFASGLCLILSAANLFYRDVKYIVEIFITFAIFFTPVLYDSSMLGEWQFWVLLNPISPLLEALSDVLIKHRAPDPGWLTYGAVTSTLTLLLGYRFFKQLESQFAERI